MIVDIYHNTLKRTQAIINEKFGLELTLRDVEIMVSHQFRYVRSEMAKGDKANSDTFTTEIWLEGLGSFVFGRLHNDTINRAKERAKKKYESTN